MVDKVDAKPMVHSKALYCMLDAEGLAHRIAPAASGKVAAHPAPRRGVLSLGGHAAARSTLELADSAKHRHRALQDAVPRRR